jgi:hypothetical protein
MVPINYWAVLVSAIAAMGLGYLWYGPLFGQTWISLMGWSKGEMESKMKAGVGPQYLLQAVGALVMAYVLAHSIIFAGSYLHQTGVVAGIEGAIWSWLGFVAPVSLGAVLWDGKPWKLWMINTGYFLVTLVVMGIILGWWA